MLTDCVHEAVFAVFLRVQHTVLDEDGDGSQDEGHKQVHVNEISGAVQLPAEMGDREISHILSSLTSNIQGNVENRESKLSKSTSV